MDLSVKRGDPEETVQEIYFFTSTEIRFIVHLARFNSLKILPVRCEQE
jgi:hypothetical protein